MGSKTDAEVELEKIGTHILDAGKWSARTSGTTEPTYDKEGLAKELVQVSRLSYTVSSMNGATAAIVGCIAVFDDPESSPAAKAASVMRSISRVVQFGGLIPGGGAYVILISAFMDLVSSILDATSPQMEPLFDRLEKLMRQLRSEEVAADVVASRNMIARQIKALDGHPDQSLSFKEVLDYAPITSGISQFKILSANEWLTGPKNQNSPDWEDVFNCHVAAVTQVQALLMKIRSKIDPDKAGYKSFLEVEEEINNEIWTQCLKLRGRIAKTGHFVHLGMDDHYAYVTDNLDTGWKRRDTGRFQSVSLIEDTSNKDVRGWACYQGHNLCIGAFDERMAVVEKKEFDILDVEIAPAQREQDQYVLLATVRDEVDGKKTKRRLLVLPVGKPASASASGGTAHEKERDLVDWVQGGTWKTGFEYGGDAAIGIFMAKPFKAVIKAPGTDIFVSKDCVYLVYHTNFGTSLAYVEREALAKGKPRVLAVKGDMRIGAERIAVSEGMVFFAAAKAGTIHYCTHDVFVDGSNGIDRNGFASKVHGSLQIVPNGRLETGKVRDIFACSDERLLVVLDSGDMWDVLLDQNRRRTRDVTQDKWTWTKIDGKANRIAWVPSMAAYNWTSLRDVVKKTLLPEAIAP